MDNQKITETKEFIVRHWNKTLLSIDRDKLKSAISPDRDWWHLIIGFCSLILVFAAVSTYLYLNIKWFGVSQSAQTPVIQSGIEEQKIKNAIEIISKTEEDFKKLLSERIYMEDPSR